MNLTDEQVQVLRQLWEDAWHYRMGEAADLNDPDLDSGDREILGEYADFADGLGLDV